MKNKLPSSVLDRLWLDMAELEDIEDNEARQGYALDRLRSLVGYLASLSLSGEDQQAALRVVEQFYEVYRIPVERT